MAAACAGLRRFGGRDVTIIALPRWGSVATEPKVRFRTAQKHGQGFLAID
jgi:hypothetical protein